MMATIGNSNSSSLADIKNSNDWLMLEVQLVGLEEISVHELVHDLELKELLHDLLSVKAGQSKCEICEIHPQRSLMCWVLRGLQNLYYIRNGSLMGMQNGRISWLPEKLSASQDGFCWMVFISVRVHILNTPWWIKNCSGRVRPSEFIFMMLWQWSFGNTTITSDVAAQMLPKKFGLR
jgi:hypothetical protein